MLAQDEAEEEVYELSPFTVEDDEYIGYLAISTLAGTRLNTRLEDIGTSISVLTKEFLEDGGGDQQPRPFALFDQCRGGRSQGKFHRGWQRGPT